MRRASLRVDSIEESDAPWTVPAAPHLAAADRRAKLAAEARRMGKHSVIAEVVALRKTLRDRERRADPLGLAMAKTRSVQLRRRFHRLIDGLVEAGGFDQAMEILRERRGRLDGLIVHCKSADAISEE